MAWQPQGDLMDYMYDVSEIFYSIQGEGEHAGCPAIFLRFMHCNMWTDPSRPSPICPFCDTKQLHTGRRGVTVAEIIAGIEGMLAREGEGIEPGSVGLVITGGEPMMQVDEGLLPIMCKFQWVDIETNGTLPPKGVSVEAIRMITGGRLTVSCSPKTAALHECVSIDQFKLLVPDKWHLLDAVERVRKHQNRGATVYLQPVEAGGVQSEASQDNIRRCVHLSLTRGYKISLQLHKYLKVL